MAKRQGEWSEAWLRRICTEGWGLREGAEWKRSREPGSAPVPGVGDEASGGIVMVRGRGVKWCKGAVGGEAEVGSGVHPMGRVLGKWGEVRIQEVEKGAPRDLVESTGMRSGAEGRDLVLFVKEVRDESAGQMGLEVSDVEKKVREQMGQGEGLG